MRPYLRTLLVLCLHTWFCIFSHAQNPGARDPTFNIGTGFSSIVNVADLLPNGNIFVGGEFQQFQGITAGRYVMLRPDGSRDSLFFANNPTGANFPVRGAIVLSNGQIVMGGLWTTLNGQSQTNRLIAFLPSGLLSPTFNPNGSGSNNSTFWLAQHGNRLVAVGHFHLYNGQPAPGFLMLNANTGLPDTTFIRDPVFSQISRAVFGSGGEVYLVGNFNTNVGAPQNRVAKMLPSGTLDTSFNVGTGANSTVMSAAVQRDGKLLIGGAFTLYNGQYVNRFARINTDGSLDQTFQIGTGFNGNVLHILVLDNDKILVTGQFTSYNGTTQNRMVRLETDGRVDSCFDIGSGFDNWVNGTFQQPDGKIVAWGRFTQLNGIAAPRMVRLLNDSATGATKPSLAQNTFGVNCPGDTAQIAIQQGTLNNSPRWVWYKDSCEGIPIDTGWAINLPIQTTGNYFVKGLDASECNCTSFQVEVQDVTPPVPDTAQLPDLFSYCELQVTQTPTATDNCDGLILGNTLDTLFYNQLGNYQITWNFTDNSNNQTTQTQNIVIAAIDDSIIFDPTPPGTLGRLVAQHQTQTAQYQWYFCNPFSPVSGANDSALMVPLEMRDYAVVITEGNCSDTSACKYVGLSTPEWDLFRKVNFFPNPANDILNVTLSGIESDLQIEIADMAGRTILSETLKDSDAHTINLQGLAPGSYLITLQLGSQLRVHRFLKP